MDQILEKRLLDIAKQRIVSDDPSHDFYHTWRVYKNGKHIGVGEGADIDVLVPATLFHDIVNYPKSDPRSRNSPLESSAMAKDILLSVGYPIRKISFVCDAIRMCSFTNGQVPDFIEGKVLQDADLLESVGAISIMRTFSSAGQLKKLFFHPDDPFCDDRSPDAPKYALDLFYQRLLRVEERLHTQTAKELAKSRVAFLHTFLDQVALELGQVDYTTTGQTPK